MVDFKQFTILIVDDDETLREAMVFDFKRKGFNILSAENGEKGFEIVSSNKIDLVVSDIRMPHGDGITLLEQIRKHYPNIPSVIFVTGFADISDAECLAKGARKVLSKPFERKELMQAVLEALEIQEKSKVA